MWKYDSYLWYKIGNERFIPLYAYYKYNKIIILIVIKLQFQELATPKAEEPDAGFLVTNVELLPLCSSKIRPGPPSDHAQIISNIVSETVVNSQCVNLKDLCIVSDKFAWVVYCDIVCIDNDGSLVDACIMALISSLKTCKLHLI